jgi:hypothetical protein
MAEGFRSSFGHMIEHLAEQPEVATLTTFDTDALPYLNLAFKKIA